MQTEKQPILDEISQLRQVMIKECIHPVEQLAEQANGAITCKFCNKSFAVRK